MHRWDAESAVDAPAPLAPEVARDGVGEFLEVVLGGAGASLPGTVTLVATDTGGEWTAGRDGDTHVAARATASDLVLLLYGRLPPSAVDVEGDVSLLESLLDAASTE